MASKWDRNPMPTMSISMSIGTALQQVWAIEKDDAQRELNDFEVVKAERDLDRHGVTRGKRFAAIGALSGLFGNAVAVGTAIAYTASLAQEFPAKMELIKKIAAFDLFAEGTEGDGSIASVDLDTQAAVIDVAATWFLPRLATRKSALSALTSEPQALTRLRLYEEAFNETERRLGQWKAQYAIGLSEWSLHEERYRSSANETVVDLEEAERNLQLQRSSLLLTEIEYEDRLHRLRTRAQTKACAFGGLLTERCGNVAVDDAPYCFYHCCYQRGCSDKVSKNMRYCSAHGSSRLLRE